MKGRTRTQAEIQYHDLLINVIGCIACKKDGGFNTWASVHHTDGRTKPNAHWLCIGLCAGHHQDGTGNDRSMIAVHPFKARFEAKYGKQIDLCRESAQMLLDGGFVLPQAALQALGMEEVAA